ncbi:MAG TPA: FG-GAP-like repeat-containing protein [Anaerolineales bacterium]|nr:FG-GAP-like repeat-containing protein [Anaerolineales bacterium]
MISRWFKRPYLLGLVILLAIPLLMRALPSRVSAGGLTILEISPTPRSLNNLPSTIISITFDRPLNPATVNAGTLMAFGKWSGAVTGTITLTNGNQTALLTPDLPFFAGEMGMVVLSEQIKAEDGTSLPEGGYSFQFWMQAQPGAMNFTVIDTLSTRTQPNQDTVAYGGVATDYNEDEWPDITVVNELTADLRVFLNLADGSGLYADFLQPTFPVAQQASPSEPADFNGDAHADIAVANINDDSISILLGNGDGTFAPQQKVSVGIAPRGIAVLDADGDGDMDIANTNYGNSNVSLLLNNGSGVFGAPTFFEGGGNGEWGLAAADMDEDGRLDLVVGTHDSPYTVATLHNNGNGTFTQMDTSVPGGSVWMLGTGDVNGDGHEDVHLANGFTSNGAILFGDGAGNLGNPTTYPTDQLTLATDLGDVDGDGDLDWVTSSYSGDWRLFLNDGDGAFTFDREFASLQAASCALFADLNNDGVLDLALIDEISDTVQLVLQSPGLEVTPTPSPTFTPSATPSPTPTQTLTPTPTETATSTPLPAPELLPQNYLPLIQRTK